MSKSIECDIQFQKNQPRLYFFNHTTWSWEEEEELTAKMAMAMVEIPITGFQVANNTIPPSYTRTSNKLVSESDSVQTKFITIFIDYIIYHKGTLCSFSTESRCDPQVSTPLENLTHRDDEAMHQWELLLASPMSHPFLTQLLFYHVVDT